MNISKHTLNSVVLILLLAIILGGGQFTLHLLYDDDINRLEEEYKSKQDKYINLKNIESTLSKKKKQIERNRFKLENYPVMLMHKDYVQQAYLFIENFDKRGNFFDFNFQINNINNKNNVIIAHYSFSGNGNFRKVHNFINYLEYSKPLFFVTDFSFSNNKESETGQIELGIQGVFTKTPEEDKETDLFSIQPRVNFGHHYNPFNPLIKWQLPPNRRDLPDIRDAQLVALSADQAYFKFGNGKVKPLNVGDQVYLGELIHINNRSKKVTFRMNMGGIYKEITKKLNKKVENDQ